MDDAFEVMDAILDPGPLDLPGFGSVEQVGHVSSLKTYREDVHPHPNLCAAVWSPIIIHL
jgi:hypothetical protein